MSLVNEEKQRKKENRICNGDVLVENPHKRQDRLITDEELQKLAHYEKLEERISWIFDGKLNLAMAVDQIQKSIEDETGENLAFSRILTNEEAEKWDKWLILEKQDRLQELPCKVGDTVWNVNEYLEGFKIRPMEIVLMEIGGKGKKYVFSVYTDDDDNDELVQSYGFDDFGNILFLTKEEADAKQEELKGEKTWKD